MANLLTRKRVLIAAGGAAVVVVGGRLALSRGLACEGQPRNRYRFHSLDEALAAVTALSHGAHQATGAFSWFQLLNHCAQSIEYSLTGYPENKPALVRRTVGPLVLGTFLDQGCMKHDLSAPIPGAPAIPRTGDEQAALTRLERSVRAFQELKGEPAPHFVYGAVSKAEYDRVHAMHVANHLAEVVG